MPTVVFTALPSKVADFVSGVNEVNLTQHFQASSDLYYFTMRTCMCMYCMYTKYIVCKLHNTTPGRNREMLSHRVQGSLNHRQTLQN